MSKGCFISLEGGEGVGKSTQASLLRDFLGGAGYGVVMTREPGGAPGAEEVRSLLVEGDAERWSAVGELLLLYAARDDHLRNTIRPALERGDWVICDRFSDSTRVYQGHVGGVDASFINELERTVVGATRPDLTIVFDLDAQVGLDRAATRGGTEDRFERKGFAFHDALRQGFLEIAQAEPVRCAVVDASQDVDTVAVEIRTLVKQRLIDAI